MNGNEKEERFINAAKAALDRSTEDLDDGVLRRLRGARHRALETPASTAAWAWASGLAAASVAVLAVTLWLTQPSATDPLPDLNDVEVLATAENLEFYDDLEFYSWLAERESTT
ncbi:MAG: DUF3619 family protein [Nitrospiraceae bacterium]